MVRRDKVLPVVCIFDLDSFLNRYTERPMPGANFDGLRVLSLEARRANEVAKLIHTYGGEPLTAPAMREIPLEENHPVIEFRSEEHTSELQSLRHLVCR